MLYKTCHVHINHMIDIYEIEKEPFRKIHRMIDLFEVIIKTHTAVMISDYFRINNLSDEIKFFLAEGLQRPSLGLWQTFTKAIVYDLAMPQIINKEQYERFLSIANGYNLKKPDVYIKETENKYVLNSHVKEKYKNNFTQKLSSKEEFFINELFIDGFYKYFFEWDEKAEKVIELRNKYAHRATPSDSECSEDIIKSEPILEKMLKAQWINETYICVFKNGKDLYKILDIEGEEQNISIDLLKRISEKNNKKIIEDRPYLVKQNGEIINLFPIMICHKLDTDENAVLFFNDLKKSKKVSMLNYPYGQYLVDENLYKLFTQVIDIDNWRKCEGSKFKNRIEELSENFIGRKDEISKINVFITKNNKGYLFIHGEPGIGKTALVSKVINELDTKDTYVLPYFVNGANSYSSITNFLDELISWLSKYDIIISKAETDNEKIKNIENGLKNLSERLGNKKIIIFIDGIDEFKEKNGDKYIDYLLGDEYENILIVYSCRETKEVQEFYNRIKNNLKQTMSIGKLDENDIWQILSSRSNKYELTQKYLNIITEKSKGNPFYIELLCISLENGNDINDIVDKLPDNIEQWFKEFIDKYTKNELGQYILSTLDVFATAKESINPSFIYKVLSEGFNGNCDERKVDLALGTLKEVLIEDKNKDMYFYLFHESFREYLNNVRRDSILDCNDNIISLCENWKKYKRKSFNTYIARFYAVHLYENDMFDEIIELSEDEEYRKFQIAATGNNTATMELYKLALESETNLEKDDKLASTALNKIKCENEYKLDVIKMLENIDYKNYKNLLNIITNFGQKEEIIIYINLLNYSLFKLINLDQMKEMTKDILSHIEKNLIEDVTIVNILDFIPMYYLVKVMAKIKEVDLNYTIIMKRMEYERYFSSLGINIRHYNGIVIEQESWIETADLNKWEYEIIDEMKKTMIGIQNELKDNEEFQIVQNEENERKESKELILEKLIYENDIQKILDYVNNEDEYLIPETVYMILNLLGNERINDKIIDSLVNNKSTKSVVISFLIINTCKYDIQTAYSYFEQLNDVEEKKTFIFYIISEFLQNNEINQAEQIFKEYESLLMEEIFTKNKIIDAFMDSFYTRKDIDKLIEYYKKLDDKLGYNQDTEIGYIIDLYIKEGELKKAEDILIEQYKLYRIIGNGMDSYYNLIEALVLNLGIQNYQDGVKFVLNYINDAEAKYRILRNLIDIFIQQDQLEVFFDYLNTQLLSSDKVINNPENINEYIVEKYYENHKEQEGKKIIINMLEAANNSENIDIKIDEYKSIALLLCRIKEYQWFGKLLNEIEKYILELDNPLKTITNEIIKQIDLTNNLELIMILVDFLKNTSNLLKGYCFNNFEKAIKVMIKLKRIEIAENLIKFIDGKVEEHRYKEYVYHKIKLSKLYFEISNVKEGNQILEYLFEHAQMREYSIQDCYYILEEMKQRNISGIHELEVYFNEKMPKEEVRNKMDVLYRLNILYYGNDIEQNKIKMNLEEMCRLIKENMDINYDSKYIYQFVEFRELDKVQEIINIKKEKIKSLESRWNKENNKILIKELSDLLKVVSKIHDFNECFILNKKINEYIEKIDEGKFEQYTVRQSYDESKVELMKELLKTENVSLIFEYNIEIQVKGNDNELFQLLNSIIMKISDEKALKLLDYINIVLYNLNISEFASELYINNKKEVALKLLEKQKNRYKCECFSKIIWYFYYSKKNIDIVFELCELCEDGENKVWLLSKAAEYIDKEMLEKYVEDINCNKKLSNYVKENAFCEIIKKIKVVNLNLVRKIISFGINNNEILTRYIILYLTEYNSNQEVDNINLDKLYNYIGIANSIS